jgi:hypothetical protein
VRTTGKRYNDRGATVAGGKEQYRAVIPHDWRDKTVVSVKVTGAILELSRQAAYDAVNRGDIPSLRIGRRLVVPVAPLRRMLGELPPLAEVVAA